jgi:hypothetical protein
MSAVLKPAPAPLAGGGSPYPHLHAPLDLGLVMGFATEAVSLLSALASLPEVDVALVSTWVKQEFLNNLGEAQRRFITRIWNRTSPAAKRPHVYVSQWAPDPGYEERLRWFTHRDVIPEVGGYSRVARLMYETNSLPPTWARGAWGCRHKGGPVRLLHERKPTSRASGHLQSLIRWTISGCPRNGRRRCWAGKPHSTCTKCASCRRAWMPAAALTRA